MWEEIKDKSTRAGVTPGRWTEVFARWWHIRMKLRITQAEAGLLLQLLQQWPPHQPPPFVARRLPQFCRRSTSAHLN